MQTARGVVIIHRPKGFNRHTAELVKAGVAESLLRYLGTKCVNLNNATPETCQFWVQWLIGRSERGSHLRVLELQVVIWLPTTSKNPPFYGVVVAVATWGPGGFYRAHTLERSQLDLVRKIAGTKPVLQV